MCVKMIKYYYKREDVKKGSNDYIRWEKGFFGKRQKKKNKVYELQKDNRNATIFKEY